MAPVEIPEPNGYGRGSADAQRHVIIHYHLFKNAGSSIERIFRRSFGKGWTKIEGNGPRGHVSPSRVLMLLRENPDIRAISSHQALLPPPATESVATVPLILFRHPIDRVRSVYLFERQQRAETPGATFARSHTLEDYVRWRLERNDHGVIHNFQTYFLLKRSDRLQPMLDANAFSEAMDTLRNLPSYGLVERFNESLALFNAAHAHRIRLRRTNLRPRNVTQPSGSTLQSRLRITQNELGDRLFDELLSRNAFDLELYEHACRDFDERYRAFFSANDRNPPVQTPMRRLRQLLGAGE